MIECRRRKFWIKTVFGVDVKDIEKEFIFLISLIDQLSDTQEESYDIFYAWSTLVNSRVTWIELSNYICHINPLLKYFIRIIRDRICWHLTNNFLKGDRHRNHKHVLRGEKAGKKFYCSKMCQNWDECQKRALS